LLALTKLKIIASIGMCSFKNYSMGAVMQLKDVTNSESFMEKIFGLTEGVTKMSLEDVLNFFFNWLVDRNLINLMKFQAIILAMYIVDKKSYQVEFVVENCPEVVNTEDDKGLLPLDSAFLLPDSKEDKTREEIIEYLLEHGAKPSYRSLHKCAADGRLSVVQEILKHNPDCLRVRNEKRYTALILAAMHGRLDVVKYIVGLEDYSQVELFPNDEKKRYVHTEILEALASAFKYSDVYRFLDDLNRSMYK